MPSAVDCPNAEWKLLFGLARYAGLRVPSESHLLTWSDVDFERCRLTVRSPKTEHHPVHDQRIVPITPKLAPLLQARFDESEPGDERLITVGGKGTGMTRRVQAIIKRASVEPWPRLWQTLRASCEKEWANTFPQYAVSKWIGHSIHVSGRHYANAVPDEIFDRAAELMGDSQSAQRQAQRNMHEPHGTDQKLAPLPDREQPGNAPDFMAFPTSSGSFDEDDKWSRGESNPRADTVSRSPLRV